MADTASTVIDLNRIVLPTADEKQRRERIKRLLHTNIKSVCHSMFPNGRVIGDEYVIGNIDGQPGKSMSINVSQGEKCGLWNDFASNEQGSIIKLIERRYKLSDWRQAYDFAANMVGEEKERQRQKASLLSHADQWFDYHDPDGKLAFHVKRTPDKQIRPYRLGKIDQGLPDEIFLYQMHRLKDEDIIYLVEGEKCADALWSLGLPATTGVGGSSRKPETHKRLSLLSGKKVIIWPDNDEAGQAYAANWAETLGDLGCAVQIVDIPAHKPEKWDCADASMDEIQELLETAEAKLPAPLRTHDEQFWSDIWWEYEPEIIEDIMPMRGVSIVYGPSTVGKSFVVLDWAYRLATGQQILDRDTVASHVIYSAFEDAGGIKRRITGLKIRDHQAPASLTLHMPNHTLVQDEDIKRYEAYLQAKKAEVEAAGERLGLVIIDTLTNAISGAEVNEGAVAAQIMATFSRLAYKLDVMILAVAHTGKDKSRGVYGSVHFKNMADTIIQLQDSDDQLSDERKIFIEKVKNGGKANYIASGYTLEDIFLGHKPNGKDITTAVVKYHEPQVHTAPAEPSLPKAQQRVMDTMRAGHQDDWSIGDLIDAGAGTDIRNVKNVCKKLNERGLLSLRLFNGRIVYSLFTPQKPL